MSVVTEVGALALIVAAVWVTAWYQRRGQAQAYRDSFERQWFDTPHGRVSGEAMRVVWRRRLPPGVDGVVREAWFCVGPGQSYFRAVPAQRDDWRDGRGIDWEIVALGEERMRTALQTDPGALAQAFGHRPLA